MAKNTQLERSEETKRRKLAGMGRAIDLLVHRWPLVCLRACLLHAFLHACVLSPSGASNSLRPCGP